MGDTFATTVVSSNRSFLPAHNFPLELTLNDRFRFTLTYTASNHTLRTTATRNGAPYGMPPDNAFQSLILTSQPDWRVDCFGVMSYSDAIQFGSPDYYGSILAHGILDNVVLTIPAPVLGSLVLSQSNSINYLEFPSKTNWVYTLERSTDLVSWISLASATNGNGSKITLAEPSVNNKSFYRVRSERP